MPLPELIGYLASLGDAIDTQTEAEIRTKNGTRYVRSREGQRWTGTTWEPHFIWVRWT